MTSKNFTVLSGKVKFYNDRKGYGFIIEDGTNEEFFFHITGVVNLIILKKDDSVYFDVIQDKGKTKAINIYKYV